MADLPEWVRRLNLTSHPEGGWFRETWRSELTIDQASLPPHYNGTRSAGTAILFALLPGEQAAWHTVRSAELWLYHRGSPVSLEFGSDRDNTTAQLLGADIEAGQHPQLIVPAGHWQCARPCGSEPSLVTCVVVPGFDFADFQLDS